MILKTQTTKKKKEKNTGILGLVITLNEYFKRLFNFSLCYIVTV